jgi:acetoin utilization deacetylase AcuC-like enzyme
VAGNDPISDDGPGMSAPTAFLLHPAASLHDTGWGHPEHQGRLRALASTVGRDMLALHGRAEQVEPGEAGEEDILRVHSKELVERVRGAVALAREGEAASAGPWRGAEASSGGEGGGHLVALDADTVVSAASWEAVMGSAGAALEAADRVSRGVNRNGFVATRPPGHHATPDRAMGFCLFNHVAVAARWLQHHGRADRVLVVDWDVHHGNGTQDVFYDDPSVFYLSLHQSPHYPGTGRASERGRGAGEGFTLNVEMAAGTPRDVYLGRYEAALDDVFGRFTPDFVVVSSGFDCLAGDPLGGLLLEPEDLHAMTRSLADRAADVCEGRLVALLEGGYDPGRTGTGAVAVLRALAGVDVDA